MRVEACTTAGQSACPAPLFSQLAPRKHDPSSGYLLPAPLFRNRSPDVRGGACLVVHHSPRSSPPRDRPDANGLRRVLRSAILVKTGQRRAEEMETIGAYEVKTHLSGLLRRVESGESFTITKNGVPVARLVPVEAKPLVDRQQLLAETRAFRQA